MKKKIKKYLKEALIFGAVLFIAANIFSLYRSSKLHLNEQVCPKGVDIVYFWAKWCPVCKMESANIQEISHKYRVVSIAVRSGSDKELSEYMRRHDLSFAVVNDTIGDIAKANGIRFFPVLIICKEGEIVFADIGYTSGLGIYLRLWLRDFLSLF